MEMMMDMDIDIASVMNVMLLFFLVITAICVIFAKNLMTSTILLSIFSLMMSAQYLVMGAVDVAITEAAVGAGISTILFLLALFLVGPEEKKPSGNMIVPIIVVLFVTAGLIYATFDMPPYGEAYGPTQVYIAPYYLQQGPIQTGIPNVVTSILASYRGFDTFGETVVILTAAIAVMLLLAQFRPKGKGEE